MEKGPTSRALLDLGLVAIRQHQVEPLNKKKELPPISRPERPAPPFVGTCNRSPGVGYPLHVKARRREARLGY